MYIKVETSASDHFEHMSKFKFKSDCTQAGLQIHTTCFSRANNFKSSTASLVSRMFSPLDLLRAYFKYLVSQSKVFLLEHGSSLHQHNQLQPWIRAVDVLDFRHCFVLLFCLVHCLPQRNSAIRWWGWGIAATVWTRCANAGDLVPSSLTLSKLTIASHRVRMQLVITSLVISSRTKSLAF